ncbi:Mur ligase family protein [Staphylococcus gallinarum]|uniref:Mur ligase family protein n=1 Tax=Staphylococcus gallinarum TaxID=1293 RepID=UPI000D1DEF94|nr:Mur ligase family protein [Staphylococcus gallinarum]PTK89447.1 glutamate ligase [Staphylococcus gallinarum]PTK95984.1 glutamate ligase [Staphylococcus gallinarum]RIO91198.1 glutamate ligase [Staphylococcus gallinarum]
MYVKEIAEIVKGRLMDAVGQENHIINDFETIYGFVKSKNTAYFSPNKVTWAKELGRSKNAPEGNDLIDKSNGNIGLIITENYVEGMEHNVPQLIVDDSVKALKTLAIHIRNQFHNPVIAITGSMGKSLTRMLISSLLQDYHVLENRGNNNIRAAIYANMLKLIKNPDYAVIETSLNAINNKENTAIYLRPDIAIVTGIGAAHFSTFQSLEQIAELKARIFKGLNHNGIAIINGETMFADYLKDKALESTQNVLTYHKEHTADSDFSPEFIQYHKGYIELGLDEIQGIEKYKLNTISEGMVSNALAAFLTLKELHLPINSEYVESFKPFSKILAMKPIKTLSHNVTLIDDTHNASLPAMINAIHAFNSQTQFFTGNKIIALGKINDLGHKSAEVHAELVDVLTHSIADYILCLDIDLRPVVNKIRNKHITWYPNKDLLMNDLMHLCNEDSLALLKSSSGGTEFPEIAKALPQRLTHFELADNFGDIFEEMSHLGQSYMIIDNKTNDIISSHNVEQSQTIEGMGPLLYYLKAMDDKLDNETITMQEWVTNNDKHYTGKQTDLFTLLESMTLSPHPSETYELVDYLFKNFANRKRYTETLISKFDLSNSIAINLTGRFRVKERQCYSVLDLFKLYKAYKYDLFKFNNMFILGLNYKSGFIRGAEQTIIFTSYTDLEELKGKIKF